MAFEGNPLYNCRAALVLGLLQLLVGVVVFALQIPFHTEDLAPGFAYVGFWAGLVFMISAILTLISSNQNSSCMIVAVMTVSILTSIVALSGVITGSIAQIIGGFQSIARYEGDDHYKYKYQEDLGISQIVLCLVEGILAIVMSAYCCAAVCCGRRRQHQGDVFNVITVPGSNPPTVIYVPEDMKPPM